MIKALQMTYELLPKQKDEHERRLEVHDNYLEDTEIILRIRINGETYNTAYAATLEDIRSTKFDIESHMLEMVCKKMKSYLDEKFPVEDTSNEQLQPQTQA